MNFSFLFPAAFSLLFALPLLLLPYLLQQRHKRVVVPALFLYQGVSSSTRRRLWGRIRLSPLFLLQLLILLLLVAIAARPVLKHPAAEKIALVLDTSASMQARSPSGQASLFETAKDAIQQELAEIPAESRISIFTTNPLGALSAELLDHLVGPAEGGEPITAGSDMQAIMQAMWDQSIVSDAPDPSDEALSVFFTQLLRNQDFEHIFFVTDRPVTQSSGGQTLGSAFRMVTLDTARPNIGISAFRLYRSPFFPDKIQATVGIDAHAGGRPQLQVGLAGIQVVIEDGRTKQRFAVQQAEEPTQHTFFFSQLPVATTYRARILFGEQEEGSADSTGASVGDSLAVDNEAYATLKPLEDISVLLVSPTPEVGDSLAQIPNVKLTRMTPQDYDPADVTPASEFRCILFHLTAPEALPPTPAAFFLPPDGNPLFALGQSAQQPTLTHWSQGHPLTAYVTVPLLTPAYAQSLQSAVWNTPLVESTVGPLLLAGERAGTRYVVTGFDLLPYLGARNLPVSILTLNIVGWLSDRAEQSGVYKTGTVLSPQAPPASTTPPPVPTAVSHQPTDPALSVRFPQQPHFQPVERAVSLDRQGVYTVRENGTERLMAVNLLSPEETDLGRPLSLMLGEAAGQAPAAQSPPDRVRRTREQPVWPWLLLAVFILCSLEWWWIARIKRGGGLETHPS